MYAVVGCSDCGALQVVEGRPETTRCPRCGTRHQYAKLEKLATSDDPDEARHLRAAMIATRQGREEAFADLDSFAEMERRLDAAGVDDEEYLAGAGLDPDAVADAAGDEDGSANNRETVLAALEELEEPTEPAVVEYAENRSVPARYVREALEKLRRRGRVAESDGTYRLL